MNDKELKAFQTFQEFFDFLKEIENGTRWVEDVNIEDVEFSSIPLDRCRSRESWTDTCQNGTALWMTYGDETIPIRMCAMQSVYDRMQTRCPFFSALPPKRKAELLTEAAKYVNVSTRSGDVSGKHKKGKFSIVDGKISAFLSDDETKIDYRQSSASKFIAEVNEKVEKVGNISQFSAYFTFDVIHAEWVTDKTITLEDPNGDETDYNVIYLASSSDVGKGAMSVEATLNDGFGGYVPIGEVTIPHRKAHTAKTVENAIDQLERMVSNRKGDLDALKKVIVRFPEKCMQRIAATLSLPKRSTSEIIKLYVDNFGDAPASAYTLFLTLCQIIGAIIEEGPHRINYRKKEELVLLKALSPRMWDENDYI